MDSIWVMFILFDLMCFSLCFFLKLALIRCVLASSFRVRGVMGRFWGDENPFNKSHLLYLVVVFIHVLFLPLFGEDSHFD